jgi:endoglucanase Acf2
LNKLTLSNTTSLNATSKTLDDQKTNKLVVIHLHRSQTAGLHSLRQDKHMDRMRAKNQPQAGLQYNRIWKTLVSETEENHSRGPALAFQCQVPG